MVNIDELHFNINKRGLSEEQKLEITEQTMEWLHDHVNPALTKWRKSGDTRNIEWGGSEVHINDIMGKEFIDCLGGYGVFNFGHMHPKIVQAAKNQLDYMGISSQELLNPDQARLAKLLADVAPGDLQYTFFSNSGTESIEAAIKLAFLYTGKHEIISVDMAYHGKTLGALSATQRDVFRKPYEPLVPGFSAVAWNDAKALEAAITDKTAAVILEPIQGEAGIRVPGDEYLPAVRKITKDKGVLLIFDEVQPGMGRTGKFLACENWGVVPDVACMAKALGGNVGRAFPWDSYETCLKQTLKNKWKPLNEDGFWQQPNFKPLAWQRAFETNSMQFEFFATAMNGSKKDVDSLPHFDAVQLEGDKNTYPLILVPYDSMRLASGFIGDPPFVIKTVEDTVLKGKYLFVEINQAQNRRSPAL